ncbi:dimethylarginine dimethylaminohydrolase [Microbacterium sp. STN6]|uniref:dimethylarginine dimethylaminohydrolase n=1 Tax=Microbacterium sp. STN6 TaxID=2995588 RepID=UPI002260AC47|nr:dimethylarginine dimethylaminohydrolase [Microbacterium sp. STN6]MCX7523315.1 dimethylarginine dimethylaminohydrolase [Microbacterium sp. STN6]
MTETAMPSPAFRSQAEAPGLARHLIASVATAVVVAFAAYAVTVLMLFAANGASVQALASLSDYFALATVIAAVLLLIAAVIRSFTRWYFALIAGVASGVLGAVIGTVLMVSGSGGTVTGDLLWQIVQTLVGINLIFWVTTTVAATLLGPLVYRAVTSGGRAAVQRVAYVRLPAGNLASNEAAGAAIEQDAADQQWDSYVAAFTAAGWSVLEVEAADDEAHAMFVGDLAVVLGDVAVMTNPGTDARSRERAAIELRLRENGLAIERIEAPATLDGRDVLVAGSLVYVGVGAGTNAQGVAALRAIAAPLGLSVVAVPLSGTAQLTDAVAALPDGTVIGSPSLVGAPSVFARFLPLPAEVTEAPRLIALDEATVLVSAASPATSALAAELGYTVVTVDVSELEKLGASVDALSVRLG